MKNLHKIKTLSNISYENISRLAYYTSLKQGEVRYNTEKRVVEIRYSYTTEWQEVRSTFKNWLSGRGYSRSNLPVLDTTKFEII